MFHYQVIFYPEHYLIILFLLDLPKGQRVRFLSLSIYFILFLFLRYFEISREFYGQMFFWSNHSSKFRGELIFCGELVRQLAYSILLLIIRTRFTCGERKIWESIKNSLNIMTIFVDIFNWIKPCLSNCNVP